MNKEKKVYEAPRMEIVETELEQIIATSTPTELREQVETASWEDDVEW